MALYEKLGFVLTGLVYLHCIFFFLIRLLVTPRYTRRVVATVTVRLKIKQVLPLKTFRQEKKESHCKKGDFIKLNWQK